MVLNDYLRAGLLNLGAAEDWRPKEKGFVVVLPIKGLGRYEGNGSLQSFGAGDVLIANGASQVTLRAQEELRLPSSGPPNSVTFLTFSFTLEHLYPLFTGREICLLQGVAEGLKSAKLYPASSGTAQHCHQLLKAIPIEFNLEYRSCLLRVAAALLSGEFAQAQSARGSPQALPEVFQRLSADDLVHLSVGELAAKLGCSRRHLNRLFRQHFGRSAVSMRMEVRLLRAASLLRNPQAKVINVAEECGFNHLGLFNTCFKRRFHKSPGEWRRLAQEPAAATEKEAPCPMHASGFCSWPELGGKREEGRME